MSSSSGHSETTMVSALERAGFTVLEVSLVGRKHESPDYLRLDHTSYPGCEAHAFTLAHAARWTGALDMHGDIILAHDAGSQINEEAGSPSPSGSGWERLASVALDLGERLRGYRGRIEQGHYPGVVWGSHAQTWFRAMWAVSYLPPPVVDKFIDYVDYFIRPHIIRLNELGFWTKESCSGLPEEHPDREPYWPYVMFEERTYPLAVPHLFTLADLAGWIPTYAPHDFDVYVRAPKGHAFSESWKSLVESAEYLAAILEPYRFSCYSVNGLGGNHRNIPLADPDHNIHPIRR
ncbi:hypothetical protein EU538_09955 [Candidatus Thorarchaeota archaeon]|nr:MAG: hypothetical protein EU538_09955 [Candidatus Thorarchaeota archaeon]